METHAPYYECRQCDDITMSPAEPHPHPWEPGCHCGSGKLLADCHGASESDQPEQQLAQ